MIDKTKMINKNFFRIIIFYIYHINFIPIYFMQLMMIKKDNVPDSIEKIIPQISKKFYIK